jgi:competence protein ComEC
VAIAWAIGVGLSLWLGPLPPGASGPARWTTVAGLLLVVRLARVRAGRLLRGGLLAAGLVCGAVGPTATAPDGPLTARRSVRVEARVGSVRPTADGARVDLLDARPLDGSPALPRRIRVQVERTGAHRLGDHAPGARIRADLRVRPLPHRCNPGARDPARSLARAGVGAVASLVDPALHREVAPAPRAWQALHAARQRGSAALRARGEGGALLAALAFGDASGLRDATREALAALGLSHLLAVSGLHVGLIAGAAFLAARRVLSRLARLGERADARRLALVPAFGVAVAYAFLAGLGVPTRRALVFLGVLALAGAAGRPLPRGWPLWIAALLLLVVDPRAFAQPGTQLSFVATAALMFSAEPRGPRGAVRGALVAVLRASAAAAAASAPLVALHFGHASPLGWMANALAVPLVALVLLPVALASGLVALCAPGGALASLIGPSAALAEGLLRVARVAAAHVPDARALDPPIWALVGSSALAWLAVRSGPLTLRCGLAIAGSTLLALAPPVVEAPARPRAVVLDVGQGDATLVLGRRANVLVDGGAALAGRFDLGESVVVPALRRLGVKRLDLVVATHADADHRGGLPAVLDALPVERLWLPPGGTANPAFSELLDVARRHRVAVEERAAAPLIEWIGDLGIELLWPPAGRPGSDNDRSLALRIRAAGSARRLLLPGDIERVSESALVASGRDLAADVLLLPHHGSRTSSSGPWLDAVRPAHALVSAPRFGRFGMPHAEVLERLRSRRVPFLWTGRDGAIEVPLDGGPPRGRCAGHVP